MKKLIYDRNEFRHKVSDTERAAYIADSKTALLDLAKQKKAIEIYYHYIIRQERFVRIEQPQARPVIFSAFILQGELIYGKRDRFSWVSLPLDEIDEIYAI